VKCKICNSGNYNTYEVREMMFGFKDKFLYLECLGCGCLQISQIPSKMSKYYPEEYYSYSLKLPNINYPKSGIKKIFAIHRDNFILFKKDLIGRIINLVYPNGYLKEELEHHFPAISDVFSVNKDTRVLDVGCGNGSFVYLLKEYGFQNCLGIDPYLQQDIVCPNGLRILKRTIHELDQTFDLIAFHHSFEHIADPLETFGSVQRLLSKEGVCLMRIPTVSSYAWKYYRENWVQLDAPRHFFLHSIQSIKLLAEKTHLKLVKVCYDSTAFQFYGSEQYLKNIPLTSDRSYVKNKLASIFSEEEMASFKKKAIQLNLQNQGDSAAFYLKKV